MTKKVSVHNGTVVFQFTHPGGEHARGISLGGGKYYKIWNFTEEPNKAVTHRRKYLRSRGEYLDESGNRVISNIDFWGEWEPDSVARKIDDNEVGSAKEYARFIQHPFYLQDVDYSAQSADKIIRKICDIKSDQNYQVGAGLRSLQNTDPFVYGDCFMYSSICKPEQTLDLDPGSIILFGSTNNIMENIPGGKGKRVIDTWYRVDTVFVIKDVIEANIETINRYRGTVYYDAALRFVNIADSFDDEEGKLHNHKLFLGATADNRINGMYSFIPSHVSSEMSYKTMRLDASMFPEISQGMQSKGTEIVAGKTETYEFWSRLVNYTFGEGYLPATKIYTPPVFKTIDELSNFIRHI